MEARQIAMPIAVLDALAEQAKRRGSYPGLGSIQEARAAVNELVEAIKGLLDCAGKELSDASDALLLQAVGDGPDDLTKEQAQAFLNARAAIAKAGAA